jgi:hypothetical protein
MLESRLRIALALAAALAGGSAQADDYFIADRDVDALVAAVRRANASPGADTIHLARDGLYAFSRAADAGFALPPVHGRLTIRGGGAELRRDTGQALALLEVAKDAELEIDALTLAEGSRGSVRNLGTLRLRHSAIVDGTTHSENAIVQNFGHFDASHSTIGYNQVTGAGRDAGIVLNFGSMRLEHCRLEGNSLSRRYPTLAAATLLNYGELAVDALSLQDNAVIDGFDGMASAVLLNLGNGRTLGTDLPPLLPLVPP